MKRLLKNKISVFAIITIAVVLDYLLDGSGAFTMMAAPVATVSGEPVTTTQVKEKSPDLDADYVSKKITEIKPESTPIDTMMRTIGKAVKVDAFKTEFYSSAHSNGLDTVTEDVAEATSPVVEIKVENIKDWNVDDTGLIIGVKGYNEDGNITENDLVVLVVGRRAGDNVIQCQSVNGKKDSSSEDWTLCPAIPTGSKIVKMGPAKNEVDAQHSAFGILPTKEYNFSQIFMAQVEESLFQKMHAKEVNWGYADYSRQNIYEMRKRMEYSFLFGQRRKLFDTVGQDEKYLTGGITSFVDKHIQYDANLTNASFVDYTKEIFTGNNGSDTRFLVAGSDLVAKFAKVDTVKKQLEAKNTEIVHGLKWNTIETNFGRLQLRHHELLNQAGWGAKGIVIDATNIEKHEFLPMTTDILELKKAGIRNTNAHTITEASCLVVRNKDTHAIFEPA